MPMKPNFSIFYSRQFLRTNILHLLNFLIRTQPKHHTISTKSSLAPISLDSESFTHLSELSKYIYPQLESQVPRATITIQN